MGGGGCSAQFNTFTAGFGMFCIREAEKTPFIQGN